jgi:hypothetical protein
MRPDVSRRLLLEGGAVAPEALVETETVTAMIVEGVPLAAPAQTRIGGIEIEIGSAAGVVNALTTARGDLLAPKMEPELHRGMATRKKMRSLTVLRLLPMMGEYCNF